MKLIHFDISAYVQEIYTVILNNCNPSNMTDWLFDAHKKNEPVSITHKANGEFALCCDSKDDFIITAKNYLEEDWVRYIIEILEATSPKGKEVAISGDLGSKKGKDFINMLQEDFGIIDKDCQSCGHLLSSLAHDGYDMMDIFEIESGSVYMCTNEKCNEFDFTEAKFKSLTDEYIEKNILEPGDLRVVTNFKEIARKKLSDEVVHEKTPCYICQKGILKIHSTYAYKSFGEKKYKAVLECDLCHSPLLLLD